MVNDIRSEEDFRIRRIDHRWIVRLVLGAFISLSFFVVTLFISSYIKKQAELASKADFRLHSNLMVHDIDDRMSAYADLLYTVKGILTFNPLISKDDYLSYLNSNNLLKRYPGIRAVVNYQYVKQGEKESFVQMMKKLYPGFSIFPEGDRKDYIVIKYQDSETPDKAVVGFDIKSSPERAAAALEAAATGQPVMTSRLELLTGGGGETLFLPIYQGAIDPTSTAGRLSNLVGFAGVVFQTSDVVSDLVQLHHPGVDIEIYDGKEISKSNLLYDSDPSVFLAEKKDKTELVQSLSYSRFGRDWTILFAYQPSSFLTPAQERVADVVLISGIVLSLLLMLTLGSLSLSQIRAVGMAGKMTESLRKFQLAVSSSSSHIIITDVDGKIVFANQAATAITGYSFEEMLGKTPALWGKQMGLPFYQKMWHQIKDEKRHFQGVVTNRRKNGEIYMAAVIISPILDEASELVGFVGIEEDITEKVKSENALKEEKAKAEAILTSIGEGVVVVDSVGKVMLCNEAAVKLLGWKREEMIGRPYKELWSVKDNMGNVVADRPLEQTLETGKAVVSSDYFYTRKDGTDFPVFLTISPVFREGKLFGVVDVFHDISVEKSIDRAKTEFVSLASHQLRTPLSAVNWYTEMLLNGELGVIDPNQKKYIEEIAVSNRRMVDLVNALLNVSRIDLGTFAIEPSPIKLVELAKDVVAEIKPQVVFKKQELRENYGEDIPVVQADEKLMRMILQNLLTNAVKYTAEGGKVELSIGVLKAGMEEAGKKFGTDGIVVKVIDNGLGIPDKQKERIFQKLFRADNVKEKDTEGTGLGLYVVKSIVDAAGGKIWFTSVENQGSSFYVFLPLSGMQRKEGQKQLGQSFLSRVF